MFRNKSKFVSQLFSVALLFLSVACSHTRPNVTQLDALTDEAPSQDVALEASNNTDSVNVANNDLENNDVENNNVANKNGAENSVDHWKEIAQIEADFAKTAAEQFKAARNAKKSKKPAKKRAFEKTADASPAMDFEVNKEQLASANVSNLIEKNLFWIALAIVGGMISAFLTVRRSRKSSDTSV